VATIGDIAIKVSADVGSAQRDLKTIEASVKRVDTVASKLDKQKVEPKVGLNTTEFDRKIRKAELDFDRIGTIADGMMGAGAKMSAALSLPIIAADVASLKWAGDLEQSTIAFETLLGSADKADQFISQMQEFAKNTPFEYMDLQQQAKRLLAYGFAAESILPMLKNVGDASAALGDPQALEGITRAIGQIQAKGKVSAEEMNQLSEAGIAGWEMIAEKIGKTIPETMKLAEQGQIDAATAIDGLMEGMEKRYGGLMDKQAETMLGKFSNMMDSLKITAAQFGEAIQPFVEPVIASFTSILDLLGKLPGPVKTVIGLFGGFVAALGPLVFLGGAAVKTIQKISGGIDAVKTGIDAYKTGVGILRSVGTALGIIRTKEIAETAARVADTVAVEANTTAIVANTAAKQANAGVGVGSLATGAGTVTGVGATTSVGAIAAGASAAAIAAAPLVAAMVLQKTQDYTEGKMGAAAASAQGLGGGGTFSGSSKGYGGASRTSQEVINAVQLNAGLDELREIAKRIQALKPGPQTIGAYDDYISDLRKLRDGTNSDMVKAQSQRMIDSLKKGADAFDDAGKAAAALAEEQRTMYDSLDAYNKALRMAAFGLGPMPTPDQLAYASANDMMNNMATGPANATEKSGGRYSAGQTGMRRFAQGGSFITSGAEAILVGDNPSGQERVTVTPLDQEQPATLFKDCIFSAHSPRELVDTIKAELGKDVARARRGRYAVA
jgi:tape measure domain-containing protein